MKLRCGKNWIQKINLEQCRKLAQLGSTFANGNDETSYASENKIFACNLLARDYSICDTRLHLSNSNKLDCARFARALHSEMRTTNIVTLETENNSRNMVTKEYFDNLQKEMANKSVESLIEEFNQQVGNTGWTSIRGLHDSVLIDTLIAKGVDVSAVYDGCDISFKRKITLNEDKTRVIFA